MTARLASVVLLFGLTACASGGRLSIPATPPSAPPLGATPATATVQALFEAGRDDEAISRASTPGLPSTEAWFGAQSMLRMGQRAEAIEQFRRLEAGGDSEGIRRAARVAVARLDNHSDAVMVAQQASADQPGDAFVQFEVGLTLTQQGDFAAAAQAFDASLSASPTMAYAHYQAGLAYNRLNRPDLTVARFETFVRLAPSAPERPQVDTILRTARGR